MIPLTMGEVSFVWSGLIEKSELRQLLDELFEDSLITRKADPWDQDLEEAYYQRYGAFGVLKY